MVVSLTSVINPQFPEKVCKIIGIACITGCVPILELIDLLHAVLFMFIGYLYNHFAAQYASQLLDVIGRIRVHEPYKVVH